MTRYRVAPILALLFITATLAFAADTPATAQPDYRLINSVAACRTIRCVTEKKEEAHGKLERTVLYAKWLMLDPSSRMASRGLFENLPTTDDDSVALMTLADWHDEATKSQADMQRLDVIYDSWPRLLSFAVRRLPEYLPAYIRYGRLAVNDMHSDYTGYERKVCRADRRKFAEAFRTLNTEDQTYIRRYVFNPDTCTPIFVSEAE